jgi:sugar phosphate isomerase/epimerase
MNIEEVSIYDSIIQAKDYISHVHFADSNRWAPGCGHLDFRKVIETLKKIDYQGYISAEILPLPDPDTAARITAETLNKLNIN